MAAGRTSNGGLPGRKVGTKRRDITKCMSGKHDWIPANIHRRDNSWGYEHDSCRLCHNDVEAAQRAKQLADDPIARKIPGRAPQRRGKDVAEDYVDLKSHGLEFNEIAERMGMKREALERSLLRSGTPR